MCIVYVDTAINTKSSKNRNYYFYLTYSSLYLLKITIQEQQGMHIDELKTVSKRRRLLLKHRVESEPQEAVRTEVNAYTYRRRLVMTLTMIR